jgi:hypothetical protein
VCVCVFILMFIHVCVSISHHKNTETSHFCSDQDHRDAADQTGEVR